MIYRRKCNMEARKSKNIGSIKLGGQEYDIFIAKSEE
jgi:hypothetical protein